MQSRRCKGASDHHRCVFGSRYRERARCLLNSLTTDVDCQLKLQTISSMPLSLQKSREWASVCPSHVRSLRLTAGDSGQRTIRSSELSSISYWEWPSQSHQAVDVHVHNVDCFRTILGAHFATSPQKPPIEPGQVASWITRCAERHSALPRICNIVFLHRLGRMSMFAARGLHCELVI
jgi:hypothetical protein